MELETNLNKPKEMQKKKKISIIIPAYNEGENVKILFEDLEKVLNSLGCLWEIIWINDGSSDQTLSSILELHQKDERNKIINFSRNFGKEQALSAGISYASGDAVISIDADLQHPPEIIIELSEKWQQDNDIVFAVRKTRTKEGVLKQITSKFFYRVFGLLTNISSHDKIGDFCLLDRKVVDILKQLPEQNRFMKGLFAWVGFKQDYVYYDLRGRNAGKTKWNYWRLWNFALEGITSFSTLPLRIWTYVGVCLAMISLLYAIYIIFQVLASGIDVPGYASLMVAILFLGGIQLITLGIFGEYLGRIYIEAKNRPLFIVRDLYGFKKND